MVSFVRINGGEVSKKPARGRNKKADAVKVQRRLHKVLEPVEGADWIKSQ